MLGSTSTARAASMSPPSDGPRPRSEPSRGEGTNGGCPGTAGCGGKEEDGDGTEVTLDARREALTRSYERLERIALSHVGYRIVEGLTHRARREVRDGRKILTATGRIFQIKSFVLLVRHLPLAICWRSAWGQRQGVVTG